MTHRFISHHQYQYQNQHIWIYNFFSFAFESDFCSFMFSTFLDSFACLRIWSIHTSIVTPSIRINFLIYFSVRFVVCSFSVSSPASSSTSPIVRLPGLNWFVLKTGSCFYLRSVRSLSFSLSLTLQSVLPGTRDKINCWKIKYIKIIWLN